MADRIWTAEELEEMTPSDQDAIFEASLIVDPASVPPGFLERVRARAQERITNADTHKR